MQSNRLSYLILQRIQHQVPALQEQCYHDVIVAL
jgi:hypothetical protein